MAAKPFSEKHFNSNHSWNPSTRSSLRNIKNIQIPPTTNPASPFLPHQARGNPSTPRFPQNDPTQIIISITAANPSFPSTPHPFPNPDPDPDPDPKRNNGFRQKDPINTRLLLRVSGLDGRVLWVISRIRTFASDQPQLPVPLTTRICEGSIPEQNRRNATCPVAI